MSEASIQVVSEFVDREREGDMQASKGNKEEAVTLYQEALRGYKQYLHESHSALMFNRHDDDTGACSAGVQDKILKLQTVSQLNTDGRNSKEK